MMEQENLDSMILLENNNDTMEEVLHNISCDDCKNIMCFNESDYAEYESWVSVDEFEMFAISLNIIVFVAGIMGNLLVSKNYDDAESVAKCFCVKIPTLSLNIPTYDPYWNFFKNPHLYDSQF